MKKSLLLALFTLTACSIWQPMEVDLSTAMTPEPLRLQPSIELQDLRFDIIRQTYEESVTDSTTETKNVDYHPMGFDLGNGLFYDLNENLSLRIDQLFRVAGQPNFKIKKGTEPNPEKGVTYKFKEGEEICNQWTNLLGKERLDCLTLEQRGDTTRIYNKNGLCYRIKNGGQEFIYFNSRNKVQKQIEQIDEQFFAEKGRKYPDEYKMQDGEIHLGNRYLIRYSKKENLLKVYSLAWKRTHLLYSILFSEQQVIIFDRTNHGYKIMKKPGQLDFFWNNNKWYAMELL